MYPTCQKLKKQLDAVNGSCFSDDMGELTGSPDLEGKHLEDGCCATCKPDENAGCTKCLASGQPRAFCTAIGACGDSCRPCSVHQVHTGCHASAVPIGIDSVQICDGASIHRRIKGSGAAAAAQVSTNKASTTRFKQLMDCLAEGSALGANMMISPSSYSVNPR